MTAQSKFRQRVYGWGLLPGLVLLWLLPVNPGHSLAQTPTAPVDDAAPKHGNVAPARLPRLLHEYG